MAEKDFKIKNGLRVGDSATVGSDLVVNGNTTLAGTLGVTGQITGNITGNVTGNVTGQVSDISNHSTTDLSEGNNLYYTTARADSDAKNAVSAVDAGGDGSFAYNPATGEFTYTGPSASEVRAHVSAVDAGGDGSFSYNSGTGQFTYTGPSPAEARAHFQAIFTGGDGNFTYDSATGTFTVTGVSAAETRAHFQALDLGGDGSFSYDSATGNFTYTGPSATEVRAHFNSGANIVYDSSAGTFAITDATIRSKVSVTDNGGDGSLSYNAGTGVITYTGPSASEVRAHVSAVDNGGDGSFSYNSSTGEFTYTGPSATEVRSHFQAIDAGGDGSFAYDSATGTYTYTGPSAAEARAHFGSGANVVYDSSAGTFAVTDATIRSKVSVTDAGGDGSLSYNAGTGVLTYTGPSASEVRAHVSAVDNGGDGSFSYNSGTGQFTYTGPSASETRAHFSAAANLNYNSSTGRFELDSAIASPLDYINLRARDPIAYSEGRLFYHDEYKALTVYNDIDSVALQVGYENWIRVYNNTGSVIPNGTPVYITGATGETPTVAPADATTEAKAYAIGIATHDLLDASAGVITTYGLLSGINTSHLTAGSLVHLAPDGSIQDAAATYPYFPTELGTCVVSDSANGYIFVTVRHHTFERFRVTGNQFVGGNLTVDGDFTVNGTQSIVNQANLAVDNSFIYSNSGDTIGSANTTFTGSGLNDAVLVGHYKGLTTKTFYVRIDGVGTGTGGVDTFEWSLDNFSTTEATGVDITGSAQALSDNISVNFNATTGHTSGDKWSGSASPVNTDAGFTSNRNTGTTGVGYTHMGAFFDVTDEKWKFFKSYYPEPEGEINTADSSYEKATIDANLTGDVVGDITGDVTGNASTATALETARTIAISGDVTGSATSFDGTSNITISAGITAGSIINADINASAAIADTKLATISTAGKVSNSATTATNANTANAIVARDASGNFSAGTITATLSGNASTATTLQTSRNFSASGDATAPNVAFNGSGAVDLVLTLATVNANVGTFGSSSQVPAFTVNAKGLVTGVTATNIDHDALTNFVANEHINHTSVSITAGSGLTGGGTIAASRTLNVGAGNYIVVAADTVSVDATSANTASKVVARDASGNFSAGTITANLTGQVSDISNHSTSDLSEGTNLYYTTARADSDAKNAISGSTGITYNPATGVITTNDGQINHDNLSGFVANEHINHTSVSIVAGSGLTGGGTIAASRTLNIGQGTGITVSADAISTNDAQIVHDNLSGFVANEHIDHTTVSMIAGNGLSGGGTIAANRTFNVGAGFGIVSNPNDISIDSADIRSLFSASGDLSYNSGTGVFTFNETYSTASELLTAIKTVDGATSGLDADLLDGQHGSYYRINVYNAAGTLLN